MIFTSKEITIKRYSDWEDRSGRLIACHSGLTDFFPELWDRNQAVIKIADAPFPGALECTQHSIHTLDVMAPDGDSEEFGYVFGGIYARVVRDLGLEPADSDGAIRFWAGLA